MDFLDFYKLYVLFKMKIVTKIDVRYSMEKFEQDFGKDFINFFLSVINEDQVATAVILDDKANEEFLDHSLNGFYTEINMKNEIVRKEFKEIIVKSYCSVFKVISNKKNGSVVEDLMTKERHFIIMPGASTLSEYSYVRVSFVNDMLYYLDTIGEIDKDFAEAFVSFLEEFIYRRKSYFSEDDLINQVDIAGVLKILQPEIFFHYIILNRQIIDKEKYETGFEDFKEFLDNILDYEYQKTYIKILDEAEDNGSKIGINADEINYHFENFKLDMGKLKFSDFDKIKFKELFKIASEDGIFSNDYEITNSIKIFKIFYTEIKKDFKINVNKILKDLDDILEELFKYKNLSQNSIHGFYVDEKLLDIINKYELNELFVCDFEYFCEFIEEEYVFKLASGEISRVALKNLVKELEIEPTKYVKNVREHHFPLIRIFRAFGEIKNILNYHKDNFQEYYEMSPSAFRYGRLSLEERTAIWLNVLAREDFYKSFVKEKDYEIYKEVLFDLLTKTYNDEEYYFKKDSLKFIGEILESLDIVMRIPSKYGEDRIHLNYIRETYVITEFGREILDYFNVFKKNTNVIKVDFNKA